VIFASFGALGDDDCGLIRTVCSLRLLDSALLEFEEKRWRGLATPEMGFPSVVLLDGYFI
jgi:hypothetical protein